MTHHHKFYCLRLAYIKFIGNRHTLIILFNWYSRSHKSFSLLCVMYKTTLNAFSMLLSLYFSFLLISLVSPLYLHCFLYLFSFIYSSFKFSYYVWGMISSFLNVFSFVCLESEYMLKVSSVQIKLNQWEYKFKYLV